MTDFNLHVEGLRNMGLKPCDEAADEIERLEAECETLRNGAKLMCERADVYFKAMHRERAEVERLEARIKDSAAPDLLAALQALVKRYQYDGIPNDTVPFVVAARVAINKATNGS